MNTAPIKLEALRVSMPLKRPYELSLGSYAAFESVLIRAFDETGRQGWGEITPLPGYCSETIEGIWNDIVPLAEALRAGQTSTLSEDPFAVSGLTAAVEHLCFYADRKIDDIRRDFVLIVQEKSPSGLEKELGTALAAGTRAFKVKVGGGDVTDDIEKVCRVLSVLPDNVRVKLDANQKYSVRDVQDLSRGVPTERIEYLEQPFGRAQWEMLEEIRELPLRIMLDESIWTDEDLARASKYNIPYVKLKLLKHGGLRSSLRMIDQARNAGFEVIWGNGFQGEIGCWHELMIADESGISTPLECNGYLKLRESWLDSAGALKGMLEPQPSRLDPAIIDKKDLGSIHPDRIHLQAKGLKQ